MSCITCKKDLPCDGDYVTCGKCGTDFHYNCSGMAKSTWKGKSAQKKAEWECSNCKTPRGRLTSNTEKEEPSDPNYMSLKKLLETMFKKHEKSIIERIDGLTAILTDVQEKYENMAKEVKDVVTKTANLQRDIDEMKVILECERQYGRSKNFIITSIPAVKEENISEEVVKLLTAMNIPIKKEEFTAHRLPAKNQTPPIIVQCSTRATRDNIVHKARKFKPKLSLINNDYEEREIYFNDNLTPYFANLMIKAKQIKKNKNYRFLWLNGGKIMIKKDESSRAIQIVKEQDLEKIM